MRCSLLNSVVALVVFKRETLTVLGRSAVFWLAALVVAVSCPAAFADEAARTPAGQAGVAYVVDLVISGDQDVRSAMRNASALIGKVDDPVADSDALVRRARNDMDALVGALYQEARYGGTVAISVGDIPVERADALQRVRAVGGAAVPVQIRVETGPLFRFGNIAIVDAVTGRSSPAFHFDIRSLKLQSGEPARSNLVLEAETIIVQKLRASGRPLAAVRGRSVVANHRTQKLDVTFRVNPGREATFGQVSIRGTKDVNPEFVRKRAGLRRGAPFDPREVEDVRTNLVALDVFQSIRIVEDPVLTADGELPITIEVAEKPPRFVGVSATYSTTEGAGFAGYWGYRNLFGGAERLRFDASVSRLFDNDLAELEYKAGATFTKPSIWTARDDLIVEAQVLRETPDAYTREGGFVAVSVERRINREVRVKGGLAFEASRIDDYFGRRSFYLVSAPLQAVWDTTDSKLDPTTGFRATLIGEPVLSLGETPSFFTACASVSAYRAFDDTARFVLAGRVALGTVLGAAIDEIPANRRFFAGGGSSVRGFRYQNASPIAPTGEIIGGRSLAEASVELRARVWDNISVVPFIDAGAAFDSAFPDFKEDIRIGAGLGVRYNTRIGPLRVDFAVPLNPRSNDPKFAVYVGLGQSF